MKPKITVPAILASMLVAGLMFVQAIPAQSPPRRIEVTAKRFEFTPGEIALTRTRSGHSLANALYSAALAMELWC
jgi:hypothetical protein